MSDSMIEANSLLAQENHCNACDLDDLASRFTILYNDNLVSDSKRNELIDKPSFGEVFF